MTLSRFALPGAETIHRHVLDNGLIVLVYENPNVESVVLHGSLRAGSMYEIFTQNGLASMTASCLMSGTKTRNFEQLNSTLEDIGAELDIEAGKYRATFHGRALAEDFPILLDVLTDALRNPVFPEEEIEQERRKRLTELNYARQDTRYMASRAFREALYPEDHPFHYSAYGSLASLPNVTAADLRNFHQKQYGPDQMVLVIVGAVSSAEVLALVADHLQDWESTQQAPTPTLPVVDAPKALHNTARAIAGKTQTDLVIGTIGPSRMDDAYLTASLANSILGEFGMMGRIGNIIREQLGLAYYAYSRLEAGEGTGAWHVTAGVSPENVSLTIEKIREEIRKITTSPVSEEDLDDNQSYFTGRLPLRLENNSGLASAIHSMERYQLGLDYLLTYHDRIYRITREDLLSITQAYLHPDKLVIATSGPA